MTGRDARAKRGDTFQCIQEGWRVAKRLAHSHFAKELVLHVLERSRS